MQVVRHTVESRVVLYKIATLFVYMTLFGHFSVVPCL
jgi:hypothetical protein